jgi:predicted amidohydrolase YtcJ
VRTLYRALAVHTQSMPATAEWLLVDDRHVQRAGIGEPPGADRVVELPGATIVPGFVDAHVHLTSTGIALLNEEVERVRDAAGLLAIARERASEPADTVWLEGFDETTWDDPALPTLADLDAVTPLPLAIWRIDGHVCLANTAAIEQGGIATADGVERVPDGSPTGRIAREANDRLHRWFGHALTDHEVQELQLRAAGLAASRGVTTVHEMSMPAGQGLRDLEVLLGHRDKLPVDVFPIVATTDIPQVMDLRLAAIGGDLPADGSIGARTAALAAPYDDGGDGAAYFEDEAMEQFFQAGHHAGLQVGLHAIGDRAIEQVLTAWEHVYASLDSRGRRHFRARRHRVEHFEMATTNQIERAAMLGLAASVQPAFDTAWGHPGGLYEQGLGVERAGAMNAFRTMLERGMELGSGSDTPVTPVDPMLALEGFERHHAPSQRIGRAEAMRVATVGSARLAHQEGKKGTLVPGAHADLVAYDGDPLTAPDLRELRPILTVSLGREVYAG